MRRALAKAATVAASVVTMIALVASPAHAAVTMPYGFAYGASTTSGTIHFTDGRSATVDGAVRARSTHKYVCAVGVNGDLDDADCSGVANAGGPDISYSIPLTIDARGGVQTVVVQLWQDSPRRMVESVWCTRTGCRPGNP